MTDSALSQLTENDIQSLNDFGGYLDFIPTKVWKWLINCPCKIICLISGNQFGKGESVVMDYYLRVWGRHPQKHKNILPDDKVRTIRFSSENLPGDNENEEVRNTQYPVLKKRFNPSWILKDITARKPVVAVQPQTHRVLHDGSKCLTKPIQFEFVSYGQSTQAQAGVQRKSVWLDESAPQDFFYEQIPRLWLRTAIFFFLIRLYRGI